MDAVAGISRDVCRRSVEDNFTAARMAANHLELYGRVIEQFKQKAFPPTACCKRIRVRPCSLCGAVDYQTP